ncbi:MAG: hypothetical protein FWF44_00335 [Defluviitaleaceae bacterium]|nr:hypothetical protein [Defluviitaleaceae bacterium]
MMKHDGKWAREIVEFQRGDGTWGPYFHTLSQPVSGKPLTTEQALRRLRALGFTSGDEPVRKAVDYMTACLRGERKMDDYWEKTHNWGLYTKLMLSAWVRIFEPDNAPATDFARRWAKVIEEAFSGGAYDQAVYMRAYEDEFSWKPRGCREIDFVSFYPLSLLKGVLAPETEGRMLDYVLSRPGGIYYVCNKPLNAPPKAFASREASFYLAALEILAGYDTAREKLGFAVDWLMANRDENGRWDMGPKANDGVYFPLSDSWRKAEERVADCTERISGFLRKIGF